MAPARGFTCGTWLYLETFASDEKNNLCPHRTVTCIFIFWKGADVRPVVLAKKNVQTCMTWRSIDHIWYSAWFRLRTKIFATNLQRTFFNILQPASHYRCSKECNDCIKFRWKIVSSGMVTKCRPVFEAKRQNVQTSPWIVERAKYFRNDEA